MKFSIIVPVYKTEKYLARCIDTLVNQDIDDYEILLIDDGSPDNSGKVCDEYKNAYSNIQVYHKQNEGLGLTRNYGIEKARGKYILFIDSDDYFTKNCLGDLWSFLENEKPDICVYKYNKVKDNVVIKASSDVFNKETFLSKEDIAAMCIGEPLKNDKFEIGSAWKAVWNREFLNKNNIRFFSERDIISEDYPFSFEACLKANKISFYDNVLYNYCYNDTSLTNTYRKDRIQKALVLYKYFDKQITKYNINGKDRNENNLMIFILVAMKHISLCDFSYVDKKKAIVDICDDNDINKFVSNNIYCDSLQLKVLKVLVKRKQAFLIYLLMRIRYGKK